MARFRMDEIGGYEVDEELHRWLRDHQDEFVDDKVVDKANELTEEKKDPSKLKKLEEQLMPTLQNMEATSETASVVQTIIQLVLGVIALWALYQFISSTNSSQARRITECVTGSSLYLAVPQRHRPAVEDLFLRHQEHPASSRG